MKMLQRIKREMESADHIVEIALNSATQHVMQVRYGASMEAIKALKYQHHTCMLIAKRHKLIGTKLRHYYHQLK